MSGRRQKTKCDCRGAAIVIGTGTNALGAMRGLAVNGIRPFLACTAGSSLDAAYMSRLPVRKALIPPNANIAAELRNFIDTLASEADCVIPTTDESASALMHLRTERALNLPCILPPDDLVDILNDKRSEVLLIRSLSIPMPETLVHLGQPGGAARLDFPVILKPRTQKDCLAFGFKNRIIRSRTEFDAISREFADKLDNFIAQEVIPGDERCQWVCNATFDENAAMVSAFTFRRLGTNPYLYGTTTFAVSEHNPEVKELSARIGKALNYTGSAMLEFKWDPRTSVYRYIEINPRLGMCNWFDTRCSVHNVYNAYAMSVGLPTKTNVDKQKQALIYLSLPLDLFARARAKQPIRKTFRLYVENISLRIVFSAWLWRDPLPVLALPLRSVARRLTGVKPSR